MLQIELSRKVHFSSGHRYAHPNWTDEKNKEVFGPCFSEHGHGHNYILEAHIRGPVDKDTGMIINLVDLDMALKEVVVLIWTIVISIRMCLSFKPRCPQRKT